MIKKLFLLILFAVTSSITYSQESFIIDSLEEAQILCKQADRDMLLIFGSKSCTHCHTLKTDILEMKLNTDRFIVCYIDIDKHPDLKRKYGITLIPDSRILDPDVQKKSIKGYSIEIYKKWLSDE